MNLKQSLKLDTKDTFSTLFTEKNLNIYVEIKINCILTQVNLTKPSQNSHAIFLVTPLSINKHFILHLKHT